MEKVKLFILCGIPGSGKSTACTIISEKYGATRFSIDELREELYPNIKTSFKEEREIFKEAKSRVNKLLESGKNVIFDSTNMTSKARHKRMSAWVNNSSIERNCVFIATPYDICVERDANRDAMVGVDVIDFLKEMFVPPTKSEKFDNLFYIKYNVSTKQNDAIMDLPELNIDLNYDETIDYLIKRA